jgi:hypothetical protein
MNIKKIKGIFASFLIFTLAINFLAPSLVVATGDVGATDINTSLTRESAGGNNPIVKAKWEMNVDKNSSGKYIGTDDATTAGSQFLPSGIFENNKRIAVCAVVTDPDGVSDIDSVYADTFYPEGIYLGPNHQADRQGCGQLMSEFSMSKLSKADGIELFCNKIRNNNNNLPVFNTAPIAYNYDEICAADGELWKETAFVYCGERDISYEDPSGDYKTLVLAQDKAGLDGTLVNYFKYLPLTAFETDFSKISYGTVKLNTHKIINGDLTWDAMDQGKASVRNVGNTRLTMKVKQDDMGLGQTDNSWNVKYDARVGSDATFKNYIPNALIALDNPLNLSETDEMDFSIDIFKFPPTHVGNEYTGNMTLCAAPAAHLTCNTSGNAA